MNILTRQMLTASRGETENAYTGWLAFHKKAASLISSVECEIRMNEPRDFAKIARVRSCDLSGPYQSSITMADKDKSTDGEVFRIAV